MGLFKAVSCLLCILLLVLASGDCSVQGVTTPCSNFYSSNFKLPQAYTNDPIPSMSRPVKTLPTQDPTHKTCVLRVSNHALDGLSGFGRNDYSRRQAFNANNTLQLVYANDGYWHLFRTDTNSHFKKLIGPAGDAEPQWHPTNPDWLYYLPSNGIGMKMFRMNVQSGVSTQVADLSSRLRARWPTAMAAWTKSEGSPSADGRYWCFMVDSDEWTSLGIVTYDLVNNRILGYRNTSGVRPDHVSMSPSGRYCVVSGDDSSGTVAYSLSFSSKRQLHKKSEHSDIALNAAGDDVYVSIDYQSNDGDVFMVNLRTGQRQKLFSTYVGGSTTAIHVSGKAYRARGWVVISSYASDGPRQWFHDKTLLVPLNVSKPIYAVSHHHSIYNGYWTEPHASVNRDLTMIAFTSNWDVNSDMDVDAYRVELPSFVLSQINSESKTSANELNGATNMIFEKGKLVENNGQSVFRLNGVLMFLVAVMFVVFLCY